MLFSFYNIPVLILLCLSCKSLVEPSSLSPTLDTNEKMVEMPKDSTLLKRQTNDQRLSEIERILANENTVCYDKKSRKYDYTAIYDKVLKKGENNWIIYGIREEPKSSNQISIKALDTEITTRDLKLNKKEDIEKIPLVEVKNRTEFGYYDDSESIEERYKRVCEKYPIYIGPRNSYKNNGCKMFIDMENKAEGFKITKVYKVLMMFHNGKDVFVKLKDKSEDSQTSNIIYLKSKMEVYGINKQTSLDIMKKKKRSFRVKKAFLNVFQLGYFSLCFLPPFIPLNIAISVEEYRNHAKRVAETKEKQAL